MIKTVYPNHETDEALIVELLPLEFVIPMAGAGSGFAVADYKDPKPLIAAHGVPMIRLVIENLRPAQPRRVTFSCQPAHDKAYSSAEQLSAWVPSSNVLRLDQLTGGAARAVLGAKDVLKPDVLLMIVNSDKHIDVQKDEYLLAMKQRKLDGSCVMMGKRNPKRPYGAFEARLAEHVVEEKGISNAANSEDPV
jgi:dTDP-glucose pyrophosphorylase